jgi:hypothetical protein
MRHGDGKALAVRMIRLERIAGSVGNNEASHVCAYSAHVMQ